jgi:outer membrane protein assembly factor BamB
MNRLRTSASLTPRAAALAVTVALLGSTTGAFAADAGQTVSGEWPQWRGPGRDAVAATLRVPATWPPQLREVWAVEVGPSDAGPVVAAGRVYTFTRSGEQEVVTALDLETGAKVWREAYDAPFKPMVMVGIHGAGPYSTPLVEGGRIFTLGISQVLSGRDAATGKLAWQRRFDSEYKVTQPFYGNALSPIVVDGKLVIEVGGGGNGAVLAVDPATGTDIWRLAGDGPAYGSPIVVDLEGTPQIVTLTQKRLIGVDAASGKLLWETPFLVDVDNTALTPVYHQGLLILGATRRPLRAYRVTREGEQFAVAEVWSNPDVSLTFSSPVVAGGSLVAFASQNKGQLVVVDPATGAVTWEAEGRQGEHSYLVASGSTVLSFLVGGELEVANIAGGKAEIVARYDVASSELWSHPVVLERHLLTKDQSHLRMWAIAGD